MEKFAYMELSLIFIFEEKEKGFYITQNILSLWFQL